MVCEECLKKGNILLEGTIWECCGELHCEHIEKCTNENCDNVRPIPSVYKNSETVLLSGYKN